MSKCKSIEFRIPDSVKNIIIVLMTIIDNMTLSLRNIFFNFDSIGYEIYKGKSVKIMTCSKCNMKCKQCYIPYKGNFESEELFEIVKILKNNYEIFLNGTEPLLNNYLDSFRVADEKIVLTNGTNIVINANVKVNQYAPAKEAEIKLYYNNEEIPIDKHSEGFKLITRVQDEAHRFAIEYHRSLRSKEQVHSVLDDIPGVGEKTVEFLRSLKEFMDYYHKKELKYMPIKYEANNILDLIEFVEFDPGRESLKMICLDAQAYVRAIIDLTEYGGNLEATTTKGAITKAVSLHGASAVIFIHNHPTGEMSPSYVDVFSTTRIESLLAVENIVVIDHIIVCGNKARSLVDRVEYIREIND